MNIECRLVDQHHQIKTVHIQGTLVADDNDGTRQIVGTIQDITESRLMEDLIRESERQYRMLSNNTLDLISSHTADEELSFIYTSASVKKLIGYEGEELIGKSAFSFYHPEDYQAVRDYITWITEMPEHS
ncbi:PAS domain S-box protein, partial [Salmonella enterica subsp. enterica serovar Enteritidis]|nr:PAS domain S-box protein [Salmonella enterica subsp. enterica serovar Enteritidis]